MVGLFIVWEVKQEELSTEEFFKTSSEDEAKFDVFSMGKTTHQSDLILSSPVYN